MKSAAKSPVAGEPGGAATSPGSTTATFRELRPEQYHQGFIAPGGWRVPFGRILRVTENGTYIVKEPTPDVR